MQANITFLQEYIHQDILMHSHVYIDVYLSMVAKMCVRYGMHITDVVTINNVLITVSY